MARRKLFRPQSRDEDEREPQPEDFTMTPSGPLGSKVAVGQVEGKFHGEFDSRDEAIHYIKNWMEEHKFWSSVFWISDHGNVFPVSM